MSINVYFYILYFQTFLSGLVAVTALYRFNLRDYVIKLIGILCSISFVANVTAILIWKAKGGNWINLPGSIYDIGFVIICIIIFNHVFERKYQNFFTVLIIVYLVGAIINLLFFQKLTINSYSKFPGSVIIIVLAITFFYRLMVEMPTMHLHRLPMFWFNSAFLLFCSGAMFLYAFTDYLVNVLDDDLRMYWSFHNLLYIVMASLLLAGIRYDWLQQRKLSQKE